jgi:hypothetical protein
MPLFNFVRSRSLQGKVASFAFDQQDYVEKSQDGDA